MESSAQLPPSPGQPSPLQGAWPRSAQWTTAFLLGVSGTLLALHVWNSMQWGARPSELQSHALIIYPIDLNRADRAELLQLPGLGPTLVDRIDAHRRRQGSFQNVDDLLTVPGIGPAKLERVRPWVYIGVAKDSPPQPALAQSTPPPVEKLQPEPAASKLIDINRASQAELQRLPGIGPKLSQRIIAERQKRPFHSVDELTRVYGIGPKTLQRLRPLICAGTDAI